MVLSADKYVPNRCAFRFWIWQSDIDQVQSARQLIAQGCKHCPNNEDYLRQRWMIDDISDRFCLLVGVWRGHTTFAHWVVQSWHNIRICPREPGRHQAGDSNLGLHQALCINQLTISTFSEFSSSERSTFSAHCPARHLLAPLQDVWLEAARLEKPANAKAVLAKAVVLSERTRKTGIIKAIVTT